MPRTERVPPLAPADRDARQAELVGRAGSELGIYATLVRHPDLFADFLPFGRRLLRRSSLPSRDRELLILRTAWRCRAAYEWSHHEVIGRAAGVTGADLDVLAREAAEGVDPATALLVRAADELVADHVLADATWAALTAAYTVEQAMEIAMLVGEYAMLAGVLNSCGVQIEPGYPVPDWDGS